MTSNSNAQAQTGANSEKTFIDQDGNEVTGGCVFILDLIAYFFACVPLTLLLCFSSLNARAATWSAFATCAVLLMIDYLRSRFNRKRMRFPDVLATWSFVAYLALGIVEETTHTVSGLYCGPIVVTVQFSGAVMSLLFQESYPLHATDWYVRII